VLNKLVCREYILHLFFFLHCQQGKGSITDRSIFCCQKCSNPSSSLLSVKFTWPASALLQNLCGELFYAHTSH